MTKTTKDFPLLGKPTGKFTEEELSPAQIQQAKKDYQAMQDLDKITIPLEVRAYTAGKQWTYRNDAYRNMVNKMDITMKSELEKLITKNSKL